MADQRAQVKEVLLRGLAFARSDALPPGYKVLGVRGMVVPVWWGWMGQVVTITLCEKFSNY